MAAPSGGGGGGAAAGASGGGGSSSNFTPAPVTSGVPPAWQLAAPALSLSDGFTLPAAPILRRVDATTLAALTPNAVRFFGTC